MSEFEGILILAIFFTSIYGVILHFQIGCFLEKNLNSPNLLFWAGDFKKLKALASSDDISISGVASKLYLNLKLAYVISGVLVLALFGIWRCGS